MALTLESEGLWEWAYISKKNEFSGELSPAAVVGTAGGYPGEMLIMDSSRAMSRDLPCESSSGRPCERVDW